MMALPQIVLEIIFLIWIVKALIRTLAYLKMKNQEYKLSVMKQFSLIFTIGVTLYILIRVSKILFEIAYPDEDTWQNEYIFVILWFLDFTGILFGSAWIFRPSEHSKSLVEVDELLDETLTEIGEIVG